MTALAAIIAALDCVEPGTRWHGTIPEEWLQGRTSYGGLSAALALHCAMVSDADLPPLRSAQVAFVGPLSGTVEIVTTLLRRGRNAAFVQADITSAAGLGLRCTFVFMRAIDSAIDHRVVRAPDFACPGPDDRTYRGTPLVRFTQNFDYLDQRDPAALGPAEWLRWTRLVERDGLHPMVELMAVADCLPPAATRLMKTFAPISSLTWQLNLLGPAPATRDGWWLLRATTDYARAGSSSQGMTVWNADGETVAEQVQSVALFG